MKKMFFFLGFRDTGVSSSFFVLKFIFLELGMWYFCVFFHKVCCFFDFGDMVIVFILLVSCFRFGELEGIHGLEL